MLSAFHFILFLIARVIISALIIIIYLSGNEVDAGQSGSLATDIHQNVLDSQDGFCGDMGSGSENTDISQAWFTTKDDKTALQSKGRCGGP